MTAIYVLLALGLGIVVSMQPAINAQVAARVGGPLVAAMFSISMSLAMVTVAWVTIGRAEGAWSKFLTLPWWVLIGGAAGALFVVGGVMIAPKIGVAMFFIAIVLGQLLGAAFIDQFGAFGIAAQAISWPRALGIALVVAGAALTQASSLFDR